MKKGKIKTLDYGHHKKDLSLYVHIPFCDLICPYCDFNKYANVDHMIVDFTCALSAEIKSVSEKFKNYSIKSIFFGGGTPSYLDEYSLKNIPDEINQVWEDAKKTFEKAGAKIKKISLPHTKYALPTYYIIAPAEASSNLARYDGVKYGYRSESISSLDEMYELTRSEGFGKEVKRRILIGTYVLSAGYYDAYYLKAQKVRNLISKDFEAAFKECDFILTPTTPSAAFPIGEKEDDPIKMYLNDIFTVPASLAGLPGISIPFRNSSKGLPLGVQLLSKHYNEQNILNAGLYLEKHYE